jgi:hypothetical protein
VGIDELLQDISILVVDELYIMLAKVTLFFHVDDLNFNRLERYVIRIDLLLRIIYLLAGIFACLSVRRAGIAGSFSWSRSAGNRFWAFTGASRTARPVAELDRIGHYLRAIFLGARLLVVP